MKMAKGRTASSYRGSLAAARSGWGGFLILPRGESALQVRLTGVLTHDRLNELRTSLRARRRHDAAARFLLLDATWLRHVTVAAAMELAEAETQWKHEGTVVLWVGLSPYLANLLLLSGLGSRIPLLPDLTTAIAAVRRMTHLPPTVARERLQAWDIMRH